MGKIIVLATPVFFALIALEFLVGWWRQRKGTGRNSYQLDDALNSISLGALSQLSTLLLPLLAIGIYTAVQSYVSLVPAEAAQAFWTHWSGWLLALVFYDFCYYWLHRMGHECAVLWAAHAVHHQSQRYNLSTALRQTSSGLLLSWIFYLPMALAGVPPLVFGVVALVDLLYQFWVHTEQIGKLGWFDRWFCSPSNHRVHHAVNDEYLDKNYGGIFLWDRFFGTYCEEAAPCVYGTRSQLNSWNPLWANAQVYWSLCKTSWHTRRWSDKVRVWLKPPGYLPPDLEARSVRVPFDLSAVRTFAPPLAPRQRWFGVVQFMLLLQGVSLVLWFSDTLPVSHTVIWCAALAAGLWVLGEVLQGRLALLPALFVNAAAAATATGALGWQSWHVWLKPLPVVLALLIVGHMLAQRHHAVAGAASNTSPHQPLLPTRGAVWLLLALLGCLAGDVLLMFPGNFVGGLAAFLVGHVFYIALFKQGIPWFAQRSALAATLVLGGCMYAWLWQAGLPTELRVPVAVYVLAIALMAAQALGRAHLLRTPAARQVALGACVFMLSDSLLAIDRFVAPLPFTALWVLSAYYLAQFLIVRGWLAGRTAPAPALSIAE